MVDDNLYTWTYLCMCMRLLTIAGSWPSTSCCRTIRSWSASTLLRSSVPRSLTGVSPSLASPVVVCSIVFSEMEHAKKTDDPTATVCAELSNHEVKCCNVFAIVR